MFIKGFSIYAVADETTHNGFMVIHPGTYIQFNRDWAGPEPLYCGTMQQCLDYIAVELQEVVAEPPQRAAVNANT